MAQFKMTDMQLEVPDNWNDQGMVTFTLPSTDKKVRPNIIVTKERLAQPVDLETYFEKIKQSVQARGIKSFEIVDEFELEIDGIQAMEMICKWDLSAMKDMAGPNANMEHIKDGQMVQQIQVSLIKDDYAVNFTASFPADQFSLYERPFDNFVGSLKFS